MSLYRLLGLLPLFFNPVEKSASSERTQESEKEREEEDDEWTMILHPLESGENFLSSAEISCMTPPERRNEEERKKKEERKKERETDE